MPAPVDLSPLPVGVVSADAIEQLDPFIPSSAVTHERRTRRRERDGVRSRLPAGVSGWNRSWQVVLTAVPLLIADMVALLLSVTLAAVAFSAITSIYYLPSLPVQTACIIFCFVAFGAVAGLYPATGISPVLELRQTVIATSVSFALMIGLNLLFGTLSGWELTVAIFGVFLASMLVPLNRLIARKYLSRQAWWGERAVIIGAGPQGRALYRFYSRATERGLRPIGLIDHQSAAGQLESLEGGMPLPYLGSVRRLERLSRRYRLRWAIVAPGGCDRIDLNEVMAHAANLPNLLILPSQFLLPSLWAGTRECAGVMGVHIRDHLRSPIARGVKRAVDAVAAATAMVVLLPLFLSIIVWIKIKSPGPVFYGHRRVGYEGKPFQAWKFRSMVTNADQVLEEHLERDLEMRRQWVEDQKLKNDPRVIAGVGEFLRKTSLDELPQLWNVLVGEMSLVGPRPIVTGEIDRYREMYPLYLRVRPGITGLWQVSGRNDTSYDQRVRLDSYYVCNWSIWLDLYITLRTVRTMLLREGAY